VRIFLPLAIETLSTSNTYTTIPYELSDLLISLLTLFMLLCICLERLVSVAEY